jgi:hypothetical protein
MSISKSKLWMVLPILLFAKNINCQVTFKLTISDNNEFFDTLYVAEAYFNDDYKSIKLNNEIAIKNSNDFIISGFIDYPTAIRVFSSSNKYSLNCLIFLDSGNATYNLKYNGERFDLLNLGNSEIQNEYTNFLRSVNVKDLSDSINTKDLLTYANKNAKSYVLLYSLINQCYFHNISIDAIKIMNILDDSVKSTKAYKAFSNEFFPNKTIQKIKLSRNNGIREEIEFKNKNDKYTLLEFWFVGCKPCIDNMQQLKNKYEGFKEHLRIVNINTDSKTKYIKLSKKVIRKLCFPWENYWDMGGIESAKHVSLNSYPTNMLIDNSGKVLLKNVNISCLIEFIKYFDDTK